MSDRAANMKLFNEKLAELKKETLREDISTNFLFRNAHFLLGLKSVLEQTLRIVEEDVGKLGLSRKGQERRILEIF